MVTVANTGSQSNRKLNAIGLERSDYRGGVSTLCAGCGHDSISSQIMAAAFELSLQPYRIIKMSGIGCSSKSPAYFLNRSHGFNALHGRMPSVATGATLANRTLTAIGVSGDGDTGSIGLGQFKHAIRRNVPMIYIVENNGVYGLTKGQFSPTADQGQHLRHAGLNDLPPIDLCMEALIVGCGFVARSFAGDAKQVRELLKAAFTYRGTAVIDIISPCITFNNHEGSTKSYAYGKAHAERLHDISFIAQREEIVVAYNPGTIQDVQLHDGSFIRLRKLDLAHDPTDRLNALMVIEQARVNHELITGLIYIDESRPSLPALQQLPDMPLALLPAHSLRPPSTALDKVMRALY